MNFEVFIESAHVMEMIVFLLRNTEPRGSRFNSNVCVFIYQELLPAQSTHFVSP